ncbi:carbohydrate ABC transporter permease [soil metagenome]
MMARAGSEIAAPAGSRRIPRRWWLYAVLGIGFVVMVAPFVWMALGAFKSQAELLEVPPTWWPRDPTLSNFSRLFERLDFPRYFFNSVLIAGAVTLSNLLVCSMVGYALAKLDFRGRRALLLVVLATLMVPPGSVVTIVPLFILMSKLDLVNTYASVILPFAAGPFGVFLMRQFMLGVPDELLDAARVDGANEFTVFFRIALPLVVPGLAALGIFIFQATWNNCLWPLVALTDDQMYTLPVALATFARGQYQADFGLLMSGALLIVLPIILVFLLLQRYFTQSIAMTGIRG